jgi:hypothetical protein
MESSPSVQANKWIGTRQSAHKQRNNLFTGDVDFMGEGLSKKVFLNEAVRRGLEIGGEPWRPIVGKI